MIKLLTKLFIKDRENVADPRVRRAYGTMCSLYGVFLNLLLFAGKYFAGVISGSVAILAGAFNNLSDAGSSIITLLGFTIAAKKPDLDHPFGHGRVEYLTGLVLSALIMLMGVELGEESIAKIIDPQPIVAGIIPAVILLVSIAVKFYMNRYNRVVAKKINSAAMEATAADSLSDAIATGVVLISMIIAWITGINIDGYAGCLVSLFIIYAGFNAAKETISPLLGVVPDKELVRGIEQMAMAHPEIVGVHDLMIHDYGPGRRYASLHAEVNGKADIFELHDAIDQAEHEIREKYNTFTTIHMDPIESDDSATMEMRREVTEVLKTITPEITVHDFRMVPGPTHTNVIFDAVVPADFAMPDEQVEERVREIVHTTWPDRFAVVEIDRSYV